MFELGEVIQMSRQGHSDTLQTEARSTWDFKVRDWMQWHLRDGFHQVRNTLRWIKEDTNEYGLQ
jgi:hypothetical protein